MSATQRPASRGFTLVELLVILGIVGLLASAALAAVDPVKRVNEARNAERWADVNAMLNGILNMQLDTRATFMGTALHPIVDATGAQVIVFTDEGLTDCGVVAPTCAAVTLNTTGTETCYANLSALVPKYLSEVAADPFLGAPTDTQYYISRDSTKVEIGACKPDPVEGVTPVIRVMR